MSDHIPIDPHCPACEKQIDQDVTGHQNIELDPKERTFRFTCPECKTVFTIPGCPWLDMSHPGCNQVTSCANPPGCIIQRDSTCPARTYDGEEEKTPAGKEEDLERRLLLIQLYGANISRFYFLPRRRFNLSTRCKERKKGDN